MASSDFSAIALVLLGGCASLTPARTTSPTLRAESGVETTLATVTAAHQATVLVFWSSGCPCVRRYQERVDALAQRYASSDVQVLAISSNAGESFAQAITIARERGVKVPLLRDEGGEVARLIGARSTPTVAVLDRSGTTRFVGWVDNERAPGVEGREPWLEQALDGLLSGTPFAKRSPTWGCTITRSLTASADNHCASPP